MKLVKLLFGRQIKAFIRNRVLRVPSEALPGVAAKAYLRADEMAEKGGRPSPSPEDYWRAVESVQAELVDAAVDNA